MDAKFWHERWQKSEIAFHEAESNGLLVRHFEQLSLKAGSRVFVPLCGKTMDIGWLVSRGLRVCGVELSQDAVEQLFDELGVLPQIGERGGLEHYSAEGVDIFVGDVFALSGGVLGSVDAIYDRAALVALPEDMRRRYAAHLRAMTHSAPQFLISLEYDQASMAGPPFSIPKAEIVELYGDIYDIERVAAVNVPGGLKGTWAATEVAWVLRRR